MKIVYHFFNTPTIHHVPKFIRAFHLFHCETNSSCRFVLYNFNGKYSELYQKVESELQIKLIVISNTLKLFQFFLRNRNSDEAIFVLHGFYYWYFFFNSILFFNKNKVLWVNWGSGLNYHKGLKNNIYLLIKKILYSHIDAINTLMSPDADYIKNIVGYKKNIYLLNYFSEKPILNPLKINKYFNDEKINILIGNHIGKGNQHVKWLNELAKFKDENIRIIIFEGYGKKDSDYINQVNYLGENIYKDKFFPFKELIDLDTYNSVMKSIDVLILDTPHQTGLAAIYSTAFFGGNVYLKDDGRNKEFMDNQGIDTYDISEVLSASSSGDLIKVKEDGKKKNMAIIQRIRKSQENWNGWYKFLYDESLSES